MSAPARYVRHQTVEAMQYLPGPADACNCDDLAAFTGSDTDSCTTEDCSTWPFEIYNEDGGDVTLQPGDWVIKSGEDYFERITAERFAAEFEAAS